MLSLLFSVPCIGTGENVAGEPRKSLVRLANEKRAAALNMSGDLGKGRTASVCGTFVSKDGLALVGLQGIAMKDKPKVETADGKPLKFGTILKLFAEQGVALMKFSHHPKVIVPLANEGPELGETIAFLPLRNNADWPGKLPSIVGPIMVKRRDISTDLKVPRFIEVLSLGSGLHRGQHDIGSVGG